MKATVSTPADSPAAPAYLTAKDCAERYAVSVRHWWRMNDAGRVPRPVRFGNAVRWSLASLRDWEDDNCRDCRTAKGGRR
ncbi:MAG: hypothetical protein RBS80_01940 [Thermoguttaceae bacterium]|nr:hypothetical protein [Thermoguttaceae bacterium]